MSRLYRALLGLGVCVLVGTSHVSTAGAITWNFTQGGGLGDKGAPFINGYGDATVTATAWNYYAKTTSWGNEGFKQASLFHVNSGGGGLGVCADREVEGCMRNVSADYQIDNYGHDDYVLFIFSAPADEFTVRIDPEVNTSPLGWDRDVSYWVGNVDPLSFNLEGKTYDHLINSGFIYGDSDGTRGSDYRDVSFIAPTYVNAVLFGPKRGGESDYSDRFLITSVSSQTSVPEPSSMLLLALGMGVIGLASMRRSLVRG